MNIYFIYSATMYDRSVGTVLTHDKFFNEEEFKELVRIAKESTASYEDDIILYLINEYGFIKPTIQSCNIEE